uniref:Uncharacterized protein n=1 Tax=Onchocerca volvulus TaxID=6282 RepID=A0A8R1TZF8_ONCVO
MQTVKTEMSTTPQNLENITPHESQSLFSSEGDEGDQKIVKEMLSVSSRKCFPLKHSKILLFHSHNT